MQIPRVTRSASDGDTPQDPRLPESSWRGSESEPMGQRRRDALAISISGVPILVASLPDVIRSKEAANREKDRAVLPALKRLQMRLELDGGA